MLSTGSCNYRRKALQRGAKTQTTTLPQSFPYEDEVDVGPLEANGFSEAEMLKVSSSQLVEKTNDS